MKTFFEVNHSVTRWSGLVIQEWLLYRPANQPRQIVVSNYISNGSEHQTIHQVVTRFMNKPSKKPIIEGYINNPNLKQFLDTLQKPPP